MERSSAFLIRRMLTLACLLALPAMARDAGARAMRDGPLRPAGLREGPAKEGRLLAWCREMGGYPSFEAQARAQAAAEERRRKADEAAAARRAAREEKKQQKDQIVADQTALKKAGYYKGAINGRSGPAMQTAITEFRQANGLDAGTTLDVSAREILVGDAVVPKSPAKPCEPQEELKKDQQALADLGFFKGAVDGCPSPMLRAAIRKFNEKSGFASNGATLDAKARAALFEAQAKVLGK